MTMNELVAQIATRSGLSKADARQQLDHVFAAIGDALAGGEDVTISGFGKFKVKASPARTGRNPRTGEEINIPAARKPVLVAASQLKDRLAG